MKRDPLIFTPRYRPSPFAHIVTAVDVDPPIGQLRDCTFVGPRRDSTADLPGRALIIAVDHMCMIGVELVVKVDTDHVVTGNEQPATGKLDSMTRAGGIPGPFRLFDHAGDLDWFGPTNAFIVAMGQPDGALPLAFCNQLLMFLTVVLHKG